MAFFGTNSDDTVTFAGGVLTNAPAGVPLAIINVGAPSALLIETEDGSDSISVTPQANLSIQVAGDAPSAGSDTLTFNGTGAAITVNLATSTISQVGSGPVAYSGIEHVVINGANQQVTFLGGASDDAFDVTPVDADSADLSLAGLATTFRIDTASGLTLNGGGGSNSVEFTATEAPDTIAVSGTAVNLTGRLGVNLASIQGLTVWGLSGADTFNVTPSLTTSILIDGGPPIASLPGDTMNLIGVNTATFNAGPENDEGSFDTNLGTVSFDHLESIGPLTLPGGATVNGTNGADAITVIARDASTHAGANGVNDFTVSVNDNIELYFLDTPSLIVNALGGSDEIAVQTPAPNGAVWNTNLTINGGLPTASDKVIFGTPGAQVDNVVYTPTGADSGTLNITNLNSLTTLNQIEHLVYDGEGGQDTITVNTLAVAVASTIVLTPAATVDSGEVAVDSRLPLQFTNLGVTASVTINDPNAGDGDVLIYNGTGASDVFSVPDSGPGRGCRAIDWS
ncbi:MAG: hypothetical protein R3C99_25835 [Pirellulaceae bacterium]